MDSEIRAGLAEAVFGTGESWIRLHMKSFLVLEAFSLNHPCLLGAFREVYPNVA